MFHDTTCVAANSMVVLTSTVTGILHKSLSLIIHAAPTAVTGLLSVDWMRGCESVAHCTMGATVATLGRPTIVSGGPSTVSRAMSSSSRGGRTVAMMSAVSRVRSSTCSYCIKLEEKVVVEESLATKVEILDEASRARTGEARMMTE